MHLCYQEFQNLGKAGRGNKMDGRFENVLILPDARLVLRKHRHARPFLCVCLYSHIGLRVFPIAHRLLVCNDW
jgi:hypothetical protein